MNIPSNANRIPLLQIFISEHSDGQIAIGIRQTAGHGTAREWIYAGAIRRLLLAEMPSLVAKVENRPVPKVKFVNTPPAEPEAN